ncbi:GNAT family N-acetyltransferase [Haloarcula sp. JP-L23]|uniref:GNAT family N-acetyltransferase n=1 Tax=Haloarcula sp. JP-L23 TaxID=2716717 RepID=UPI00140EC867|nr:GNAT family N-acetyltransferase [Haloarcula sp. JP-L23]
MELKIKSGVTDDVVRGVTECYGTYASWADRDREQVETAIEHSDEHLYALDPGSDEVVASARVLTDYCYYGVIYDVIVHEEYRGTGVGRAVVEAVTDHPPLEDVTQITLIARDGLVPFYEKCGFERHPMTIEVDGETEAFNRMVLDDGPDDDTESQSRSPSDVPTTN